MAGNETEKTTSDAPNVDLNNVHRVLLQGLGSIVSVLVHSPPHRDLTIAGIEKFIVPAVVTGQFAVAEGMIEDTGVKKPIAFVLWGSFSEEIDAALQASPETAFPVNPADWRSGDCIWITEAAGSAKSVTGLIQHQQRTVWRGRTVRMRTRGPDGYAVKTFPARAAI